MSMTVRQLRDELNRLVDVGRGGVPVYIGDFEPVNITWIADDSTRVYSAEKASGFLIE